MRCIKFYFAYSNNYKCKQVNKSKQLKPRRKKQIKYNKTTITTIT